MQESKQCHKSCLPCPKWRNNYRAYSEGGQGGGDTGIRGAGGGDKGAGDGGRGSGERGGGGTEILGAGIIRKFVVFY